MKRKIRFAIFGAGAAAGLYAVTRVLGKKRLNTLPFGYGIKFKRAVTVNAPAEQLYGFWRNPANLSALFDNVMSVNVIDHARSHWTLCVPGRRTLEWDAEITIDRENEMIGWRSLAGADLDSAGSVRFERAAGGEATIVRIALQYNPPGGRFGAVLSTLFGEKPSNQIKHALEKFKGLMEGRAGEVSTAAEEKALPHSDELVEAASEDSFPASDPPSWTGTTGPTG